MIRTAAAISLLMIGAGCGGESRPAFPGTYTGTGDGMSASLTLEEGGRYHMVLRRGEEMLSNDGAYSVSGDSIFLQMNNRTWSGTLRDGTIVLTRASGEPMAPLTLSRE